jgi:hypothetical protein
LALVALALVALALVALALVGSGAGLVLALVALVADPDSGSDSSGSALRCK